MAKDLQIYPCTMGTACNSHACYERSEYIIARKDLDLGTAMATGTRICAGCAKNLVANIPAELVEGSVQEFVKEAVALSQEIRPPEPEAEGQVAVFAAAESEEVDEIEEEVYRCVECDRDFQNKGSYVRHMNSAVHKQ